MDVKTIEAHGNVFGDQYAKAKGDVYNLPHGSAQALIDSGVVEAVKAPSPETKPAK